LAHRICQGIDCQACAEFMGSKKKKNAVATKATQQPEAEAPPKTKLWPAVGTPAHLAIVFVLGVVVLFTYANTVHNTGFALDNKFIILEDPRLRDASPNSIRLIFHEDYWWPRRSADSTDR